MQVAILISADTKLAQQVDLWVRQFFPDSLKIEIFKNLELYKAMLETPEDPNQNPGAESKDQRKIRIMLLDLDLMQQTKPAAYVAQLQQMNQDLGRRYLEDGAPPKILIMGFDGGPHRLDSLQNEVIDDLILKPLDRSLLMQKLEYLASDDAKLTPNFLFRAKANQIVEVGRDVVLDEVSEFAVSVRSPGPVPEGNFAAIHADIFGAKGSRRLIGRVYESARHPVREGEYVVRFSYFGISPEQLSTVRRFIKANQTPVRAKALGGAGGSAAPAAKPGLSKELQEKMALLKMRKFAVIDLSPDVLNEAKSAIESGFKGVTVRVFPSYTRLVAELTQLLPEATAKPGAPKGPVAATPPMPIAASKIPALPGGRRLGLILRGKSRDLSRFEPALGRNDIVLGKAAADWIEKPDSFVNAIYKDDRESFEEFLSVIELGTPGKTYVRAMDATGSVAHFECSGTLEKAGDAANFLVRIDISPMEQEAWNKAVGASASPASAVAIKDPSQFRFEAILIDGAYLRPDPTAWYTSFVELLRTTKVLGADEPPPKIFVMSDPKARAKLEDFRIKGITDFSLKPIDRRFLVQKYQAFFPTLLPTREPESPPFIPCEIGAKLGKEVVMEEVSEFGLTIQHPTAFRDKTFMRFFSRLFGEDGEWVTGKCHYSEKNDEHFRCLFLFFGPAEDLTQRIRRWIREDYVAKKDPKT